MKSRRQRPKHLEAFEYELKAIEVRCQACKRKAKGRLFRVAMTSPLVPLMYTWLQLPARWWIVLPVDSVEPHARCPMCFRQTGQRGRVPRANGHSPKGRPVRGNNAKPRSRSSGPTG